MAIRLSSLLMRREVRNDAAGTISDPRRAVNPRKHVPTCDAYAHVRAARDTAVNYYWRLVLFIH